MKYWKHDVNHSFNQIFSTYNISISMIITLIFSLNQIPTPWMWCWSWSKYNIEILFQYYGLFCIKRQSCHHIETSQLICSKNQLTGFYMSATLAPNGLNYRSSHPEVFLEKGVLKICIKFTEEHPWQSVISIKLFCKLK